MIDFSLWIVFLLISFRITAFLVASPVLSMRNVPAAVKVLFGFSVALVLLPTLETKDFVVPVHFSDFLIQVIGETLVGLTAGTAASFVFAAIRTGGKYLDIQMGFAMAQVVDPANGMQNTLVAQFLYLLGILLFFVMDAHHTLIVALTKSFDIVSLGGKSLSPAVTYKLVQIFVITLYYSLKIALPIMLVLVTVDLSLGFISRVVPHFNVLMMGFPLKIGIGIMSLVVVVPLLGTVIRGIFDFMEKELLILLRGF